MKTVKAVLVGCGGISDAWFRPATTRSDLEIVGLVDLNEAAANEKRERYGLGSVTGTDLAAVLKNTGPDVVFDCTVPEAHRQVTLTALDHGCHVLGEKPMADSMAHAREMVAAAERAGKVYAVIQNRRYLPGIRAVREFLESGRLGAVTTVQSNFFLGAHFGGFRDVMQHVLLLDMAIHTFDAARFILGADAEHVYCHEWNPAGSWYAHGASAIAVFGMTNGSVYSYQGSWCAEGLNTGWESDWHILCERGSVHWNGGEMVRAEEAVSTGSFISDTVAIDVPVSPMPEARQGHAGLIDDFITAVRTGEPPLTVCTDNIKSLAMVHGAISSADTGSRVSVNQQEEET